MNSTYCPLPFKHVFIEPRGIKACCSYINIFPGSIDEWLESEQYKQLCSDILNGRVNDGCKQCIEFEKISGYSTRLGSLNDYSETYTESDIDYIDYRGSNLCNYRCRSCSPEFSHGILNEVKKSELLFGLYSDQIHKSKVAYAEQQDKQWIIDNISNIKRLMFAGGEPTLIPEVNEILSHITIDSSPEEILIITNGSFTDDYWYNLIKSNKNINWTLSLDAIGEVSEIIRHGTIWDQVDYNIRFLAKHSYSFNFSTVISSLNLMHIGDLFEYVNIIQNTYSRANGKTQFMSMCNYPKYLSPFNWPDNKKNTVLEYLCEVIDKYPTHSTVINNIINAIKANIFDSKLWEQGIAYNTELNKMRRQNFSLETYF